MHDPGICAEAEPQDGAEDPCEHGLCVDKGAMRSALRLDVAEVVHDPGQHRLVLDERAVVGLSLIHI